jgi:alkanesulfonate monooxygenase SsuD/methylene tetrahydromethanopterin reductase-like flavin-dependent oxidoreductase (luciferase family)
VPFTVAAAGRRALAVAARLGATWVTFGPVSPAGSARDWYRAVADQAGRLDDACGTIGRDPASIRRMVLVPLELDWAQSSVGGWDDLSERLTELGMTDVVVHWPRPDDRTLPGPAPAVFDEISARLAV